MNANDNVETSVYSIYYINNLQIPSEILGDYDTHVSKSLLDDSTVKNVYNSYYIDRFTDVRSVSEMFNNKLIVFEQIIILFEEIWVTD